MKPRLLAGAALSASLAVHAGLLLYGPIDAPRMRPRPPSVIAFSLAAPPAPGPVLQPPPPEPPPARRRPTRQLEPAPLAAPARRDQVAELAAAAPTPELTGTTLVSDLSSSWSAPAGNGAARDGALGADNTLVARRSSTTSAPAPVREPRRSSVSSAVPLGELARKPTPPSLTASLARNFPQAARNMGKSGQASVRAVVEPSGEIQRADVTSESSSGFGEACRRSLIGSRWGVPLDRTGRPVATWITYRCKFRVDD